MSIYDFPAKGRMAREVFRKDLADTFDSLVAGAGSGGKGGSKERNSFYRILTELLSIVLVEWAYKTLDIAVRGCPYETGKLRSSGTFRLFIGEQKRVAGGWGGDTDKTIDVEADRSGAYKLHVNAWSVKKGARYLSGELSFNRTDKGLDIARWTHEELNAYVPRPKNPSQMGQWYARHEGTGPKYLERPVRNRKGVLTKEVNKAVNKAVKIWKQKHKPNKRRKGKRK